MLDAESSSSRSSGIRIRFWQGLVRTECLALSPPVAGPPSTLSRVPSASWRGAGDRARWVVRGRGGSVHGLRLAGSLAADQP